MSRIPRVTGSDLLAALSSAGFAVIRIKGSHHFVRHEEGRSTVVPSHAGETNRPRTAAQNPA
jgi:predicted RNA binding protein YcfA (HicA-like mRNA interferase family)